MRNCIMHRRFVIMDAWSIDLSREERRAAMQAHLEIEKTIQNDPGAVILDKGNPALVKNYFEPGEDVMLLGAYRGGCLETALKALQEKGVHARYHPIGSI